MRKYKIKNSLLSSIKNAMLNYIYEPLHLIKKNKPSFIALIILLTYAGIAILGPVLIPLDLTVIPGKRYEPPSLAHLFGTDWGGRDLLAMMVHGSRDVLVVAFLAALITVSIGSLVGTTAGFAGGVVDSVLMSVTDIALTIPSFPLILVVSMSLPQQISNPFILSAVLSITSWAGLARAVRSQTLQIKSNEFIEAATTLGLGVSHIVLKEIIPLIMPYLAVGFLYSAIGNIYATVGLYYLGALRADPTNWGIILGHMPIVGPLVGKCLPHLLIVVGTITLLQGSMVFLCSGLEVVFNPRLREE